MDRDQSPVTALGAVPTLWFTIVVNIAALLVAVVGIGLNAVWPLWLPIASLALGAVTGVVCLLRGQTRPFGVGCIGGTAVSVMVFLLLFAIFFVTYFIFPGGHQLS